MFWLALFYIFGFSEVIEFRFAGAIIILAIGNSLLSNATVFSHFGVKVGFLVEIGVNADHLLIAL